MENASFIVLKNERGKLYRLALCVLPGIVLAGLLRSRLPTIAVYVLMAGWPVLTAWTLVFRPNQTLQVTGDRLLRRDLLTRKEKEFRLSEIREARFDGFSVLRRLTILDDSGKAIVRLEADMENLDRLVEYLRENRIPVKNL